MVLLFGQIVGTLLLRSSPSGALTHRMRYVGRLRKQCLVWANIPRLTRSLRLHPTESSQVRVGAFSLRLSASASGLGAHRHPTPPNNSFKPTPHRGVNSVLCATLHAVATPLRGGLTQALGGRETFVFSRDFLAHPLRSFSLRCRLSLLRLFRSAVMQCFG